MEQGGEQRSRRRKPLVVEVSVSDEDALYLYTARNVSGGGMFIDAPVPLPVGTRLQIEFKLPVGAPIRALAEVRWTTDVVGAGKRVRHPGMGVVFLELSDAAARRLRRWAEQEG